MPAIQAEKPPPHRPAKAWLKKAARFLVAALLLGWLYGWASPWAYPTGARAGFAYGLLHGALMPSEYSRGKRATTGIIRVQRNISCRLQFPVPESRSTPATASPWIWRD